MSRSHLNEDTNGDRQQLGEEFRVSGRVVWTSVFVAFSGLWHYGFSIGSTNAAYLPITKFMKDQYQLRYDTNVTSGLVEAVWATSSSAYPMGGLLGTFLITPLARKFGRRMSMLLGHIVIVFLSAFMGLSLPFHQPEMIIITRFGLGVVSGAVGTGICPMYIAEISPLHVRGAFGTLIGIGISIGIFAGNVIGLPQALGNDDLWPVLLALTGYPSLLFIILYRTIPESPRKLFLEDGDVEKSVQALQKLNGKINVDHILNEMREEEKVARCSRVMSVVEALESPTIRLPMVIAAIIASAQQLSGTNGISFNLNLAYTNAGIPTTYAPFASVGVTGVVVVVNLLCMLKVEVYGRKKLLILSYSIQAFCLLLVAISTELQYLSSAFSYVAVIASLGFLIGFGLGIGPVTHIILPEFFDQASRSAGMMFSSIVLWASFALCVFVTPYMLVSINGYTFVLYCFISFFSAIFVAWKVPETKNRTFAEILTSLTHKNEGKN